MPVLGLYSADEVEAIKADVAQPLQREIADLRKKLRQCEEELKAQKAQYDKDIYHLSREIQRVNAVFRERESNMEDMLDRFAAKNFDNGKRHSSYVPKVTGFKKIHRNGRVKTVITFSILFPFPSRNEIDDVRRIKEHIESLVPNIASEMNVEFIELVGGQVQADGWLARFECEC